MKAVIPPLHIPKREHEGWIIIHWLFDHQPPTGFFHSTIKVLISQHCPVMLLDCSG